MSGSVMAIGLGHYLALAAILFLIGLVGFAASRRNLIVLLMSVEIMLLAANINFVAFSAYGGGIGGQVFAMIVLAIAAAEAALGLAIFVTAYRARESAAVADFSNLKG